MSYKKYNAQEKKYLQELVYSHIPTRPENINSKDIAMYVGINSRDVRYIIQTLRDDGHPICGTPEKGYWVAQSSIELKDTLKQMESHIVQCQETYEQILAAYKRLKEEENVDEY